MVFRAASSLSFWAATTCACVCVGAGGWFVTTRVGGLRGCRRSTGATTRVSGRTLPAAGCCTADGGAPACAGGGSAAGEAEGCGVGVACGCCGVLSFCCASVTALVVASTASVDTDCKTARRNCKNEMQDMGAFPTRICRGDETKVSTYRAKTKGASPLRQRQSLVWPRQRRKQRRQEIGGPRD